ncbi:MAG: hypothetical protein GY953_03755, partial [bacterium]|nr:hypothetical protein [bacterium]
AVDVAAASPDIREDDPKLAGSKASPELIRLVVRCLRPSPEERYAEACDILAELEPMSEAGGKPAVVIPAAAAKRWQVHLRIPPLWAWAIAVVLLAIVAAIWGFHNTLPTQGKASASPAVSEAADLSALAPYRKARELLGNQHSAADLREAVALLESAVEANPAFVPAHATIVEAGLLLYRETADQQWVERAALAAETARQLDEELPQTKIALASSAS